MRLQLVLLAVVFGLSSCGGCNSGKGGRFSSGRNGAEIPAPAPGPEGPAPAPAPPPSPQEEDKGVEVPPITQDSVSVIDTNAAAGLKHLIFETSTNQEAGRFLSEFLIVVRANEKSCIRLKTRPTSGLTEEVGDDILGADGEAVGACTGQKLAGETKKEEKKEEEKKEGEEEKKEGMTFADHAFAWEFKAADEKPTKDLAPASAALCSPRLYRMEESEKGLEKVVSKTGRLVHVGSKVRIWLDEEVANVCTGGVQLDQRSPIAFGPLIQDGQVDQTWKDKIWLAHLQNLAGEMDKILTSMTSLYGGVSDIDSSGFIEVFISPHVNRRYFVAYESGQVDDFRAQLIFRPQDLALYNAQTNPLSNEGEILYLWAPDPAGIYNMLQYPSANSLASNYAKGYLAAQAMTLIIANQKLFIQKQKEMEDRWLVESLSLLTASYYAGNDYPFISLAQYLTSRPQYIPLVGDLDDKLVSDKYRAMAYDETLGMRGMFGWYLHERLCPGGDTAPCAKLKDLIEQKTRGKESVSAVFNKETFEKISEHFGLSVGVSLLDNRDAALAFWDKGTPGLPMKPLILPALKEIFPADPRQTEESDHTATLLTDPKTDRTVGGPFTSMNPVLFQPIASDNDMEFEIAKDAVTYILVTALVDQKTDVTALFGKGLNVTFIPAGERNSEKRRIHVEKLSEQAHADLRPENLTAIVDGNTTLAYSPVYTSIDYTVTPTRQIWILGSTDNFDTNVGGTAVSTGDTDAYVVKVDPCAGVAAGELTACQNATHEVLVQTIIRDFEKELAPMLLVTETDRAIFRGHGIVGRMAEIFPQIDASSPNQISVMCQSALSQPVAEVTLDDMTNVVRLNAHGFALDDEIMLSASGNNWLPFPIMTHELYQVVPVDANSFSLKRAKTGVAVDFGVPLAGAKFYVHQGIDGQCANGGVVGAQYFSHDVTRADPTGWAHPYYNFLSMGPLGFPFTNQGTFDYSSRPACPNPRCLEPHEHTRMYLNFGMEKELVPTKYVYYALPAGLVTTFGSTVVELDEKSKLVGIKTMMDSNCNGTGVPDVSFVESCATIAGLTNPDCQAVCSDRANIEAKIRAFIAGSDRIIVCADPFCDDERKLASAGTLTGAFFPRTRWYFYSETTSSKYLYSPPIEPFDRTGYCAGNPGVSATVLNARCLVETGTAASLPDIRQQLFTDATQLNYARRFCNANDRVCIDRLSTDRIFDPDGPYAFEISAKTLPSDRQREMWMVPKPPKVVPGVTPYYSADAIYARAGEVIAKPERLHAVRKLVPGGGQNLTIIVGGRNKSQGKYMVRVQVYDNN